MSWFQWALQLLFRKKPTYQEMLNGIVPIPGPPRKNNSGNLP